MKLDALAIGAHPDDIELSVSGTLIKLAELGYRVGVVDMVRGELRQPWHSCDSGS
jgi:LmbE family N-acetylglucosaminyl deacetylase